MTGTNKPTTGKAPATCPACARAEALGLLWEELEIYRCSGCGLGLSTMSTDETLYEADYFEHGEYYSYQQDQESLTRNFRRVLGLVRAHVPHGCLLEIGSAYGYFLAQASEHYTVTGIDISAHAAAFARHRFGLNVERGDFLQRPPPERPWDVVCLWDTVEHLRHPVETLAKGVRELRPGGILALTTGDFGSAVARLRGKRWRQIHPPTHLFYFTVPALRALFRRSGLEVCEVRRLGFTRSYRSVVQALLARRGRVGQAAATILTAGGRLDVPIHLNTFDYVYATGRKPNTDGTTEVMS